MVRYLGERKQSIHSHLSADGDSGYYIEENGIAIP